MADRLREERILTAEEKEKITRDMIDGYKKMASLNQQLAENGFIDDETN